MKPLLRKEKGPAEPHSGGDHIVGGKAGGSKGYARTRVLIDEHVPAHGLEASRTCTPENIGAGDDPPKEVGHCLPANQLTQPNDEAGPVHDGAPGEGVKGSDAWSPHE